MTTLTYGLRKTLSDDPATVEERVRLALKDEGFGVLTEIDVTATLAEKLGVTFPDYKILGACNPTLAHGALQEERDIGLLLPCNVVVYRDDQGGTVLSILDPEKQLAVSGREDLADLAAEVKARMERVLDAV
jgi:uncharacterized protein (DUF302 family)